MSSLLRSSRAKFFSSCSASLSRTFSSSSLPRSFDSTTSPLLSPPPQVGALPSFFQLFHRNTATPSRGNENPSNGNLTGLPKPCAREFGNLNGLCPLNDPINKLGSGSNKINPLDTIALAGAGYGVGSSRVWAAKGPMLSGLQGSDAATLGLSSHRRVVSTVASTTNETKPSSFRPLSPHLPVYQPQLSSTLSIFNRIAGAILSAVILLFYMIYMKMGLISLTFDSFYQFLFYSSKLNLLILEISGLALSYHLYMGIRHLLHLL